MIQNRAVFLDLNGTIVLPLKQESLSDMTLIPGADTAIRRLLAADFLCPVVTVQARIAKGLFTEAAFRAWFAGFFGKLSLDVKGPYICPHRHGCPCAKPSRLLYDQAAADLSLDLSRSYAIGDSPVDMEAAQRFGGLGCLVRTGWAADPKKVEDARGEVVVTEARSSAAFIGETIAEAVDWILRREQTGASRE